MEREIVANPPVSVRDQIVRHLETRFRGRKAGVDGANVTWNFVSTLPLTKNKAREGPALGIYDVSERSRPLQGYDLRNLNLVLEFFVPVYEDENAREVLNLYLAEVIRTVGLDPTMGCLALNAEENGNELDIDGTVDKVVSGVVIFDVQYRTRVNNPFVK